MLNILRRAAIFLTVNKMETTRRFELVPTEKLVPYVNNARVHTPEQVNKIRASLREFGFIAPVLIDKNFGVIAGHGRLMAAREENITEVPCVFVEHLTETQKKAYIIADNKLALDAEWDEELLKLELDALKELDFDISYTGFSDEDFNFGDFSVDNNEAHKGKITEKFLFAPFSVLDTRTKRWIERKTFWIKEVGVRSDASRQGMTTTGSLSGTTPRYYEFKEKCERKLGRELTNKEFEENYLKEYLPAESMIASTESGGILSIFDPVLCELMYYWFCPSGGNILDPFAGGNVRGVMATFTGHGYTGIDIRQEQVNANIESAQELLRDAKQPKWICGDSLNIDKLISGDFDMVFSCPPYFDLEKYSDNPADISNMSYENFLTAYREIIRKATARLKENRFAVFVVGDIRDQKTGMYRNFVSETISAFESAGLHLYNEMILVTQCGSLPIRVGKSFQGYRKVGKTHQNILVFYKGENQKRIKEFGDVEIYINDEEN